jgi:molybdate transport system regulatory protein
VARIGEGAVTVEVALSLAVGKSAIVLIKFSFVSLALDGAPGPNRLRAMVAGREHSEASSEISLALGVGKTLIATLAPSVDQDVIAVVAPSDIILAVE